MEQEKAAQTWKKGIFKLTIQLQQYNLKVIMTMHINMHRIWLVDELTYFSLVIL